MNNNNHSGDSAPAGAVVHLGGAEEWGHRPGSGSCCLGALQKVPGQRGSRLCSVPREGVKPTWGTSENQALGLCYLQQEIMDCLLSGGPAMLGITVQIEVSCVWILMLTKAF